MTNKFQHSGINFPCPVCGRIKDKDCRFNDEIVLCHTHPDGGEFEGFIYKGRTDIWGKYLGSHSLKAIRPKAKTTYDYPLIDKSGLLQVVRIDDGEGRKTIRQRYRADDLQRWVNSIPDEAKSLVTLYRINDHVNQQAIANGKPIFLVEGESCAEALLDIGIAATTAIGGSGKWNKWGHHNYLRDLQSAKVVICPDRDIPGLKHAQTIAQDFPKARWFYANPDSAFWENLPKNGGLDVADWIEDLKADGLADAVICDRIYQALEDKPRSLNDSNVEPDIEATFQDYLSQVKRISSIEDPIRKAFESAHFARHFKISPREFDKAVNQLSSAKKSEETTVFALDEFLNIQFEGNSWVIPGLIPAGETIILAGMPKEGKSLVAYDAAYAVAVGDRFIGETPLSQGRVLMIMTDESTRSIQSRLKRRGFKSEHAEKVRIITRFNISHLSELENELADFKPTITIIDSLKSISRGSEISENSSEYSDRIYALKEMLSQYDSSGLLIHHSNKNQEARGVSKVRGSTAIAGAAWGIWIMESPKRKEGEDPPLDRTLHIKVRDGGDSTYKIKLDPENFHWTRLARSGYSDEALTVKARVYEVFKLNQGKFFEPIEVVNLLPGIKNRSIRSALKRLVDDAIITKRQSTINSNSSVYGIESQRKPSDSNQGDESFIGDSSPEDSVIHAVIQLPNSDPNESHDESLKNPSTIDVSGSVVQNPSPRGRKNESRTDSKNLNQSVIHPLMTNGRMFLLMRWLDVSNRLKSLGRSPHQM